MFRFGTGNILRGSSIAIAILGIGLGIYASLLLKRVNDTYAPISSHTIPFLMDLDRMSVSILSAGAEAAALIERLDQPQARAHLDQIAAALGELETRHERLTGHGLAGQDFSAPLAALREELAQADAAWLLYQELQNTAFDGLDAQRAAVGALHTALLKSKTQFLTTMTGAQIDRNAVLHLNRLSNGLSELAGLLARMERLRHLRDLTGFDRAMGMIRFQARQAATTLGHLPPADGTISGHGQLFAQLEQGDPFADLAQMLEARAGLAGSAARLVDLLGGFKDNISRLVEQQHRSVRSETMEIAAQLERDRVSVTMVAAAISIAICILLFVFTERRIVRRLHHVEDQVRALNADDLNALPVLHGSDGLASLSHAVEELRQSNKAQRTLSADLRQAKEAADRSAAIKSEFLSMMSHEIRTPLNAIMGLFSLLENAAESPRQKTRAQRGLQAAESLHDLLTKVLDASRLEADMIEIDPQPVHLPDLIDQKAETLRGAVSRAERDLRATVIRAPGLPLYVTTDAGLLRQILHNLIDNAVRFTDSGEIWLTVRPDQIGGAKAVRFEIRDTGAGIAPEDKDKIFEAFRQVDSSIARKVGGTGLGLAIARKLAFHLGMELGFESEPGTGSTFFLLLRAQDETAIMDEVA